MGQQLGGTKFYNYSDRRIRTMGILQRQKPDRKLNTKTTNPDDDDDIKVT